jgi:hypothetical protein
MGLKGLALALGGGLAVGLGIKIGQGSRPPLVEMDEANAYKVFETP